MLQSIIVLGNISAIYRGQNLAHTILAAFYYFFVVHRKIDSNIDIGIISFCIHLFSFSTPRKLFPVPCLHFSIPCFMFLVPSSLFPVSCFLFPVPCSLFPVPCSLFPVPCSLLPVSGACSFFSVPCSQFAVPCSLFLGPSSLDLLFLFPALQRVPSFPFPLFSISSSLFPVLRSLLSVPCCLFPVLCSLLTVVCFLFPVHFFSSPFFIPCSSFTDPYSLIFYSLSLRSIKLFKQISKLHLLFLGVGL